MKLNTIQPAAGAKHVKRRVGREIALYSVQDAASLEAFLRAEIEGGA